MKKLIWVRTEVSRVCSEYWWNALRIQCEVRQTSQLPISQDLGTKDYKQVLNCYVD